MHREACARPLSPREQLDHDMRHFSGLGQACHNQVVRLLVNSVGAALSHQPELFMRLMPEPSVTLEHHRQVLKAMENQDEQAAATLTEEYLAAMTRRFRC
jgi:DNA-binding FadR family transcriptional regulator